MHSKYYYPRCKVLQRRFKNPPTIALRANPPIKAHRAKQNQPPPDNSQYAICFRNYFPPWLTVGGLPNIICNNLQACGTPKGNRHATYI